MSNLTISELAALIVEPSATQRSIISRALRDAGVLRIGEFADYKTAISQMGMRRFSEAASGVEALEKIAIQQFDLIVTDYNMPRMDGRELVDEIRNNSVQSSVPILMFTSESNQNRLAAVQQAGVSAICDKPYEFETIRSLVQKMLTSA